MHRIVIVAPSLPDLPLIAEEAATLRNLLAGAHLLAGEEATARGIINAVSQMLTEGATGVDFWFATHGGSEGIVLTRGYLDPVDLAYILNAARSRWAVLNTCGSRDLVGAIHLRTAADVVATESDQIADGDAWQFARLVALEMSRGADLIDAVHSIAPGGERHRYYRNEIQHMTRNIAGSRPAIENGESSNARVLRILDEIVRGNQDTGLIGLQQSAREQRESMAQVQAEQRRQAAAAEQMAASQRRIEDALGYVTQEQQLARQERDRITDRQQRDRDETRRRFRYLFPISWTLIIIVAILTAAVIYLMLR